MRLFLAIRIPADIRSRISAIDLPLSGIKPVAEENLHLTLKFLGETDASKVKKQISDMRGIAPFTIELEGLGVFPNSSRARILWAGVTKGDDDMTQLHKRIEEILSDFAHDDKFSSHVTVARMKYPPEKGELEHILDNYSKTVFGSFEASSFDLMASELLPFGPKYSSLESYDLIK